MTNVAEQQGTERSDTDHPRRACVIGYPVAHSRSPVIHGFWLTQYGISGPTHRTAFGKGNSGMLLKLRGRTHQLHSAITLAEGGAVRWAHVETADLTMRDLSAEFIGQYLGTVGEAVLGSVGVYEIEGLGAHLFREIKGDSFTIQGMPLIALLNFFYDDGVLSK